MTGRIRSAARRSLRTSAFRRFLLALGLALLGFVALVPAARTDADVSGAGCAATIAGVDVVGVSSTDSNTAIHVKPGDVIHVSLTGETGSPQTIHVDYGLIAGFKIGRDGTGSAYDVKVSDYVNASGLYLVQAYTGPHHTCSAAALVDIDGGPLGTLPGDISVGVIGVGIAGLVVGTGLAAMGSTPDGPSPSAPDAPTGPSDSSSASGPLPLDLPGPLDETALDQKTGQFVEPVYSSHFDGQAHQERFDTRWVPVCGLALPMALLMTTMAMVGALPAGPLGPTTPARVRVRWRPRLSVLGIAGGIIGA